MATRAIVLCSFFTSSSAFTGVSLLPQRNAGIAYASLPRRNMGFALAAGAFNLPEWMGGGGGAAAATAGGSTNSVVKVVAGVRHRRLGGGDIVVSELGLGTQRWGGADYNSPDEALCHQMLDFAVANGINLVDTAEQYPIPSDLTRPEGRTEEIIGNWLAKDKSRREKLVIATKITGGANITPKNIIEACEGSLQRLQTDYIDVYNLHWPARYFCTSVWRARARARAHVRVREKVCICVCVCLCVCVWWWCVCLCVCVCACVCVCVCVCVRERVHVHARVCMVRVM